jgi:hypothetical protein
LIGQLKTPHSTLQFDEAANVIKDTHLITYVWYKYVLENYTKEDFLFRKATDDKATLLEVVNIINCFVEKKETGRTVLDCALTETSQCLGEMQDIRHW